MVVYCTSKICSLLEAGWAYRNTRSGSHRNSVSALTRLVNVVYNWKQKKCVKVQCKTEESTLLNSWMLMLADRHCQVFVVVFSCNVLIQNYLTYVFPRQAGLEKSKCKQITRSPLWNLNQWFYETT